MTEFLDAFTTTVRQGYSAGARILWNGSPFTARPTALGPNVATTTLLVELGELLQSGSLSSCLSFLPGPYEEGPHATGVASRYEDGHCGHED